MNEPSALPADSRIPEIAAEAARRGGRLLVVGGFVRDRLLGAPSKDVDLEIFGLELEAVDELLEGFESIGRVGQHFPIWRLRHQDLDIAYPRDGAMLYHSARPVTLDEAFARAARHRDLSLNAMAWDPLDERTLDPFGGIDDLEARRLRAVDAETFVTDPVRGLRVARLCASLDASVDEATLTLCRSLDLSATPVERQTTELRRMLTEPERPSRALDFLAASELLEYFPVLTRLRGTPQDPRWHPEGDVFTHTLMVVDAGREIARDLNPEDAEILQWAALCHDLGKPDTTTHETGRIRSIGHEDLGAEITKEWLGRLRVSQRITGSVSALVAHHLAPAQFTGQAAGPSAYRRLARRLADANLTVVDLERVARADHLGRTTDDALAGKFDAGRIFLETAAEAGVVSGVREDVVTAQVLMDSGFSPGPNLGRALTRSRTLQDNRNDPVAQEILAILHREFKEDFDD